MAEREQMFEVMDQIVDLCTFPHKYVYQYRNIETAFKMLETGTVRLNPIEKFNDPTEVERFNEISLDGESSLSHAWDLLFKTKEMHRRYRVACFSLDRPEAESAKTTKFFEIEDYSCRGFMLPRMWAQYGDNNHGICFVFDREKLHNAFLHQGIPDNELLSNRVKYFRTALQALSPNDSELPTILGEQTDISDEGLNKFFLRFADWFFFHKQLDWSNECEFRWVYVGPKDIGEPLDFRFNDAITAIIVGHKCSTEIYPQLKDFCLKYRIRCLRVHLSHVFPCILPASL